MKLDYFVKGVGIPIEEFLDIITKGFSYIDFERKDIYYLPHQCVFVGNGYCPHSCSMVKTYPLTEANDKVVNDGHYWDWKGEKYSVFNFEDYNKTWSVNEDILREKLKEIK